MKKVLIVEDDESLAEVAEILLSDEGYKAQVLFDGDCLQSELKEFEPDVILMDINLPGESGDVLTSKIKASKLKTPVILMSSVDNLPKVARRVKADGYVRKPYNFPDLLYEIEKILKEN